MFSFGILAVVFNIPIFVTLTCAAALIYMLGRVVEKRATNSGSENPTAQ